MFCSCKSIFYLHLFLQDDITARLIEHPQVGQDLEMRTLTAYVHQCTAEAQEGEFEDQSSCDLNHCTLTTMICRKYKYSSDSIRRSLRVCYQA